MKISFWKQLVGSMVKLEYYSMFIQRPIGKAVLYLVSLIFIISIFSGIQLSLKWNEMVNKVGMEIQANSPDFIFTNGELTVEAPMPYVVSKTKDFLFIVDTIGEIDENILKDYPKGLLIGKNKIINKQSAFEIRSYDLSSIKEVTYTKSDVVTAIPWLKWVNIILVIFMFIFGIISQLVAALLVCICGWIASKIMKCQIGFNDIYKISIYTLTLPLLLELVKDLSEINIPYFRAAFYIIAIIYTVRVLRIRKNTITFAE